MRGLIIRQEIEHMKTINKTSRNIFIASAIILVVIGLSFTIWKFTFRASPKVPAPDYWPTQGWRTSTPEQQGLDSVKLAEGLLAIQQKNIPIHNLIVIRNGWVVLDATFYPYDGKTPHNVASVTKSLTATLIGIAVDQGKLNLTDKLVSFFPDTTIANLDARKKSITLRDLVTMTSGLDCVYEPNEPTVQAMEASPNWVQFGLDLPMAYQPGTHYEYCGVGMHLLSGVLEKATGMTTLEFAQENMFTPLGIQSVTWPTDPQGVNLGAGNIRLNPEDMAKIGLLYLQGGAWDGRQVISRSWADTAVKKLVAAPNGNGYGYGWWSSTSSSGKSFFAEGKGGQVINVNPGYNAIVVTIGGGFVYDDIVPYIVAALLDPENPLPANPAGVAELQQVVATLALPPAPQALQALPAVADAISGKSFRVDQNLLGIELVRLDFMDPSQANLQITYTDGTQSPLGVIGLDGIYRLTPGMNLDRAFHRFVDFQDLSVGLRGAWSDAQTFLLEYDTIVNYYFYRVQMHFEGDRISLVLSEERTGAPQLTIEGRMENP